MGTLSYSVPTIGQPNSTEQADVATALDALKTLLNGNVDNANIDASAAIAYSKLALTNSILNADINSAAGIDYSKLDLAGSIVNADIGSSAAIAYSKLANLTSAQIIVGSSANVPTARAVTGDVTISDTGVTTIGADKVDYTNTAFDYKQDTVASTTAVGSSWGAWGSAAITTVAARYLVIGTATFQHNTASSVAYLTIAYNTSNVGNEAVSLSLASGDDVTMVSFATPICSASQTLSLYSKCNPASGVSIRPGSSIVAIGIG